MEQLCPYCGSQLHHEDQCAICQNEVTWVKKCYLKSEYYYIKAYEAAGERKLTAAKMLLEKAIHFNKYNVQARNLLGLIHYELGEIALGLKSWIMSVALEKEDNIASEYINKVQSNPKVLETYREASGLYNKAIRYLKQGNEDVGIISLKKAVSLQPRCVESRALLALYYIKGGHIRKANEQLKEVLKIDRGHIKAVAYLEHIKNQNMEHLQVAEVEHRYKQGPKRVNNKSTVLERSQLFLRYTVYFLMGVLCMWIVERNLVIPAKIVGYEEQITGLQNEKEELTAAMDTLKLSHEEEVSGLQVENDKLRLDNSSYEETLSRKNQQEKLTQSEGLMNKGDYEAAAQILYNVIPSYLSEEEYVTYTQLKSSVYEYASSSLCNKGYEFLQKEEFNEAQMSLEMALLYEPRNDTKKRILYYLGRTEKGLGNKEKAITYFKEVIDTYPNTTQANWAKSRLSEIED